MDETKSNWERDAIVELANAGLKEQRRARRWGVFFKLFFVVYLIIFLIAVVGSKNADTLMSTERHTALVSLIGVIADGEDASANNVVSGLRAAFENENSAAVILNINSPGGSPVQSAYINTEIKRLREMYPAKPIYAVVSDICASGGVYVAVAADKIFANESSIVGSIGVRMDGFGLEGAIEKLGIERRLLTAGEHKAVLDPFSPENPVEKQHVQSMLDDIHQEFIDVVKEGRGDRLANDPQLFTGLFWTGTKAMELGLVDGLGSAGYVAREVVGVEDIVDYSYQEDIFQRFAGRIGSSIGSQLRLWLEGVNIR
ncbi:MAG: signal peptide peptidase SppA [Gammaproteobacteria bacterium]